ncbi:MAG: helix-turn-helix transcriptional regulator [Planctomycetota bacterium]|nr:MAG: helix-turn-helix transcriptional regulator [Planctomycetota bacterium]
MGCSDVGYKQPDIILLNEKQWTYVQNRYNLTPRERQIAELVCKGLRNGNIAKYLCIKPGTVKTHMRNIYRKVHVKSKIAMLLRFVTDSRDLSDSFV